MDPEGLPELLDFKGPNGQSFVRQAQFRYTHQLAPGLALAAALENPEADVTVAGELEREDSVPDAAFHVRWEPDWGHLQASGLLRRISVRADGLDEDETGWGAALSGKMQLAGKNSATFQINVGDGIGRYIADLAGIGADAAITPAGDAIETLEVIAGYLGYQHWWSDTLRSNLVYSHVEVDVENFQAGSTLETTQYAAANLIWSPVAQTNVGIEYLYGRRENANGEDGSANRLQISSQFLF
jgi:hypothetical protein